MTLGELLNLLAQHPEVVLGKGVDAPAISNAEARLSSRFPGELKEYLAEIGRLEIGHFELYGLGTALPQHLDIIRVTISERTEVGCPIPASLIPLLNDGGGNHYCVAAGDSVRASVFFWAHDEGTEQIPETVSESLFDWIAEMVEDLQVSRPGFEGDVP